MHGGCWERDTVKETVCLLWKRAVLTGALFVGHMNLDLFLPFYTDGKLEQDTLSVFPLLIHKNRRRKKKKKQKTILFFKIDSVMSIK